MGKWLLYLALGCCSTLLHAQTTADDETEQAESLQAEEPPRPALRSRHQLELQRLQTIWPTQFRALDSEYDSAGALYLPANSSKARGWVILLPGSGQAADAAYNIDRLRHALADSGWHTLSLQLPPTDFVGLYVSPLPPVQPASGQTDGKQADAGGTAEAPETTATPPVEFAADAGQQESPTPTAEVAETIDRPPANTPSQPEYAVRIQVLIDTAVAMARAEQTEQLVLLGQHEGAHWAMLWADKQHAEIDALFLLHPHEAAGQTGLEELASRISLPITDYYSIQDQGSTSSARQRLNGSRRNPDRNYHQIILREPAQALREDELVRRVKGRLATFDTK